jgi:peptide/nickel transport system substrate-binding protein
VSRQSGWKRAALGAVAITMAVMGAACSSASSTTTTSGTNTASASGAVEHGGTGTILGPTDPNTLDPAIVFNNTESGSALLSAIYDSLFTISPTGQVQPRLAQSFTTADGITWTLTLRPGVKFSDGTPFDAAAVKDEWARILEPSMQSVNAQFLAAVSSMTVASDLTLVIKLKGVNFQFKQAVESTSLTWIPSPAAVKQYGSAFGSHPVGAGPFVVSSISPQVETVMKRNPDYWEPGKPYLNDLVFKFNPDQQQSIEAVQAGQADVTTPVDVIEQKSAKAAGLGIASIPMAGVDAWFFNEARPPFNNILAREAVYDAVNEQQINNEVYGGLIQAPSSVMATSSVLYDPSSTFAAPNAQRAQQLFNQLAAEGHPVKFTYPYQNVTVQRQLATALETQLAAFKNVTIQLEPEDVASYTQFVLTDNFDLIELGLFGGDPEPVVYTALYTGAGANFGHVNYPAIDSAVLAGRSTASNTQRRAAYASLVQAVNKEYVALWAFSPSATDGAAAYTSSFNAPQMYGEGTVLWDSWGQVTK